MKYKHVIFLGIVAFAGFQAQAKASSISLGTASNFGVLAGSTVTNSGPSMITGDLGVYAGTSITGFPPGTVLAPSTIHSADAVADQAQEDNLTAYNTLAGLPSGTNLSGQDLGGLTLMPGVYKFNSTAGLNGTLALNNTNDPNGLFVFQIGSTFITQPNAAVIMSNGDDPNVFWQVSSSATLDTGTQFKGNILASSSITLNTGANISCGRALAHTGAVTMLSNNVSTACATIQSVPEPDSSFGILGFGLLGILFGLRKKGS